MRKASDVSRCLLVFGAVLLAALPAAAQEQTSSPNSVAVTTVVTVLGKKFTAPPVIGKEDVNVYEGDNRKEVKEWIPTQGDKAGLELAIVIDDADNRDLGIQLDDIRNFIKSQPQTTGVAVFYANNGGVSVASQFNTDHEAVVKTLRMPMGNFGAYSSIYHSVMDLISRWPVTGARREILLIADGIDRFGGDPVSPNIQSTIERAQKAGIIIHTLFANGVGRVGRMRFRISYGQSNLSQIAEETGGQSFFQGFQTPISFAPYLTELDLVLKNQYLLTFATHPSKSAKGELRGFKIRTEQRNVDIFAPKRVFVPGAQ
jgi:hypothetical protein